MSQVRLYLDEDYLEKAIVQALRRRDVDLVTAAEAGMRNRSDEDNLIAATNSGGTLLSYNVAHFCALHHSWTTAGRDHSGILLAPQQRYGPGEEIRRILRLMDALAAGEMHNRLEFLSSWG